MQALLLVGGFGTRLRPVLASSPKPLAEVGGRTFLELLICQLRSQGIRRIVMCTGYLGNQIEETFGDGEQFGVTITYSQEMQPMGTGGAVKLASRNVALDPEFIVMNGDSFIEVDIGRLSRFHREHKGLATIAVRYVEDTARYGRVEPGPEGRIVKFLEKSNAGGPGLVNAGVYVFDTAILARIKDGPASLEQDVFPAILDSGVFAYEETGLFIDIGTPEDYAKAKLISSSLYGAASVPDGR
jgi:D-glycero-alpha-D-manno-heptose 1-phosphate guanylyltransferase